MRLSWFTILILTQLACRHLPRKSEHKDSSEVQPASSPDNSSNSEANKSESSTSSAPLEKGQRPLTPAEKNNLMMNYYSQISQLTYAINAMNDEISRNEMLRATIPAEQADQIAAIDKNIAKLKVSWADLVAQRQKLSDDVSALR